MSGISNLYIMKILEKYNIPFLGVFAIDTLPQVVSNNSGLICNLSRITEKGSHFIAMYFKNSKIFYFDPLALDISVTYFKEYLDAFRKCVVYKRQQIQDDQSEFCGFFCMYFILEMCFNHNYQLVFSKFKKENLIDNDEIVIKHLKHLLKNH